MRHHLIKKNINRLIDRLSQLQVLPNVQGNVCLLYTIVKFELLVLKKKIKKKYMLFTT